MDRIMVLIFASQLITDSQIEVGAIITLAGLVGSGLTWSWSRFRRWKKELRDDNRREKVENDATDNLIQKNRLATEQELAKERAKEFYDNYKRMVGDLREESDRLRLKMDAQDAKHVQELDEMRARLDQEVQERHQCREELAEVKTRLSIIEKKRQT